MNKLITLFFVFVWCRLFAQDVLHSSTLTLGVGGTPYSDNPISPGAQTGGPAFTGNYEFRISRYLAAEDGTDILLPSGYSYEQLAVIPAGENLASYTTTPVGFTSTERSRVALSTYGLKGILPLAGDRLELFAGAGGAYAWNSLGSYLNGPFAQVSVGGRLAIDRGHRFWLGTTLRGFASFGPGRQDWVPLTFDFGIRFAH